MQAIQVREINSLEQLAELRAVWSDLLAATPGATFFHSLDWLETYWQYYGRGASLDSAKDQAKPKGNSSPTSGRPQRLRVLLVEADGEPIGILPLVVTSESYRIGQLRVLGYPLAGWGSFYGPIGPHPATTLHAGLAHIHRTPRDWDLLDLRWVDATLDHNQTPQAFAAADFSFDSQLWHESAQIDLAPGWANYWARRTSRWRNNVRRCERLLAERGAVEHLRYRPLGESHGDYDPHWDLYDACVGLAQLSWQGSSATGTTLSHDSVNDFLRAAHQSAARAGAVDLNLLLLNARPVAFAYNYHYRGSVYGLRSGFDPCAAQEGAGTVLMQRMIEDSCRRGDRLIDLGPNYLEAKRYWLTHLQSAWHYTHFHPARWRAQALRLKQIAKRWLNWSTGTPPQDKPLRPKENPVTEIAGRVKADS